MDEKEEENVQKEGELVEDEKKMKKEKEEEAEEKGRRRSRRRERRWNKEKKKEIWRNVYPTPKDGRYPCV